jgi:hypothetical protein
MAEASIDKPFSIRARVNLYEQALKQLSCTCGLANCLISEGGASFSSLDGRIV